MAYAPSPRMDALPEQCPPRAATRRTITSASQLRRELLGCAPAADRREGESGALLLAVPCMT